MSHRNLGALRQGPPEAYYLEALRYGHFLWQAGHPGRAILALTRALYTDLPVGAPVLQEWPLPYRALGWIVATHPSTDFPGNPRVSFQHQATRQRGARSDVRRARAWAVWHLIRRARPALPADPKQPVDPPTTQAVGRSLDKEGLPGEREIWESALTDF